MDTSFSSVITSYALSIGFSKAGITTPDLPNIHKQRLSQWLDAGYNANMQWMAKRNDFLHPPLSPFEGGY